MRRRREVMNQTPRQVKSIRSTLAEYEASRRATLSSHDAVVYRAKPRRQWPMMLLGLLAVIVIGLLVGLILMLAYCEAPADPAALVALGLGQLAGRGATR